MNVPKSAVALGLLAASSSASGQHGSLNFNFPNGSVYTGAQPVQVELWVHVTSHPAYYAFASWMGDVLGDDPTANWSNLATPLPPTLPVSLGTPGNGSVLNISVGQLHFPLAGIFAKTDNPIMIWSGEWSSTDLTPRFVELQTKTVKANAYLNIINGNYLLLSEALGEIRVVPAPPAAMMLLVGPILMRRRSAARANRAHVIEAHPRDLPVLRPHRARAG